MAQLAQEVYTVSEFWAVLCQCRESIFSRCKAVCQEMSGTTVKNQIFDKCQRVVPEWAGRWKSASQADEKTSPWEWTGVLLQKVWGCKNPATKSWESSENSQPPPGYQSSPSVFWLFVAIKNKNNRSWKHVEQYLLLFYIAVFPQGQSWYVSYCHKNTTGSILSPLQTILHYL